MILSAKIFSLFVASFDRSIFELSAVEHRDLAVSGDYANVEVALAIVRAEDLEDIGLESQVLRPGVREHVVKREEAAMRHKDIRANEDEAAKELAVVLDALVEDFVEVEVALDLRALF